MTDQAVQPATAGPGPHSCTGRDRELRALRADLESAGLHTMSGRPLPQSRVLLIAGAAGSGRTTLAEEFVRQVADRYPGGVLRARLTEPGGIPVPTERTARDLLASLARSTGPARPPGEDAAPPDPPPGADPADVAEALRSALERRGRVLLLLDDVADSEQLLDLAPESRDCLVVAVSSGPLTDVPDVRPCALGGLDRASAVALLSRHAGSSPRVTVDPRSAETLIEQCGALPAALTLLGGWLGAHPKRSLLDASRALAGSGPPGREAEQTAEAARSPAAPDPLERSFWLVHDSLPRPLGRLLRLLALAPAGFVDPQLASALGGCSLSTAHAALDDYVRLGLLRPLDSGHYQVPGCLDPLLRAASAVHEQPDEVLLARARMLERLVSRLQACRAVCEPSGSEARRQLAGMPRALRFLHPLEARSWLRTRRPALLSAVRAAVAEGAGELDTLARRLVSALARAFDAHEAPEQAASDRYELHELVLLVAERNGRHRERAAALLNLGDLDARTDRWAEALVRYRAALDAAREGEDEWAAGRALESLGDGYAELADWDRAADWYGRALALRLARDEHADRAATARLHGRIGAVHTRAARPEEALRAWRAAAAAFRRLQEPAARARALAEVAAVQEQAGRWQDALRTWGQACEVSRGAGDTGPAAELALRAAEACERAGSLREARRYRTAAARLRRPAAGTAGAAGAAGD
ncbi:tetratricopeptide repeat protein [Streptomyces qinglanensis]|uniref:Tetratricopeptide repeat-containing protein n=1 Tax=Streptomyces qinglanensis TaxID=943816 RepID=A0A1H9T5Z7_9ACTN|nr:tetratricopeptide repeat protein [Streptomyces qinglanensis]SER92517.1 Tetratricopeptide repeat-containing protein [Streptomyces qinglanensis]